MNTKKLMKNTLIALSLFMVGGCGVTRRVNRTDSRVDSSVTKGIDTSSYKSILDRIENMRGETFKTTTIPGKDTVYTFTTQKGETQYVYIPGKETVIREGSNYDYNSNEKTIDETRLGIDTTQAQLSKAEDKKTTEVKIGFNTFQLVCLAIIALSIVFLFVVHFQTSSKVSTIMKIVKELKP